MTTETLKNVAGNDEYLINNHLDEIYDQRRSLNILFEARNLVGKECPYNVLTSNCEHFATLLRYGNPQSKQVRFGMTSHTELNCTHKCLKSTELQTILCQNVFN